jgi:Cd2+/Zn2+-exporting ATPase
MTHENLTLGVDQDGQPNARDPSATAVRLRIPDMDCPSCVAKIQRHLGKLDGVEAVHGSPMARTLTVELNPEVVPLRRIQDEVARLGYMAQTLDDDGPGQPSATWGGTQAQIAYASLGLFAVGLVLRFAGLDARVASLPLHDLLVPDLLFVAAALVGGWNFFPRGVRAARALALDMNFLMTIAILGAVLIGEYTEAASIAFLFALAELLESYAVDRARASVEALLQLAPETAVVLREGREIRIPAGDVVAGEIVLIRPGERVPTDGEVVDGASALDQSPITGESMPVEKGPGDPVFAGSINREGALRVRVERPSDQSTLARIVQLVEEAEATRTRSERFVERFARWYTPVVTVSAILVTILPIVFLGAPVTVWVLRGLTLLVIACPCALVISTPVAVVSGVTAAARRGVLIKGGIHLEALGDVRVVALDKTGTLTYGHPVVDSIRVVDGVSEEDALARAAAVETRSEHPLARAILEAAEERGIRREFTVTDFESVPGKGARATLDGERHVVGSPELVPEAGVSPPMDALAEGGTVVGVFQGDRLLAWISLSDRPRRLAAEALARIRREGIGQIVMLTGDREETARSVGLSIGVDEIRAGLLPEEKVDAVRDLERRYGPVAMVGDGVNDAPALAAARVGIAMGAAGSDTALETADIALMGDDLSGLPYLLELSRRARRVIRQNVAAAIVVKAVLAAGVPLGLVSLITAVVVGDMGVSLAVTLNALRLGRVAR